jgi:hypothetical protein
VRLGATLMHPQQVRLLASFLSLADSFETIALGPWHFSLVWVALLGAAAILLVALGPAAAPVAVGVFPLAAAVVALSTWQAAYDSYWFLCVVPAGVLTIVWTIRLIPGQAARATAAALLLATAVAAQAPRIRAAALVFRMPEYAALVRGSREAVRRGVPVRRVDAPFLPPLSDSTFVFSILGGELRPDAPVVARVSERGDVTYGAP